jgi:DNA polymerase I-like protein with 3'-5' exonuclease and polymerase domains
VDETDDLAAFLDSVTGTSEEEAPKPTMEVSPQPVVEATSPDMSTDDGLDDIFGLGEVTPEPQPVEATPSPVVEELGVDDLTDGFLESLNPQPEPPSTPVLATPAPVETTSLGDEGDDIEEFWESSGLQAERDVPDITKPWMKFHEFVRVTTPEEVESIVEAAIKNGRCSLDLETEGLDNRIRYLQTETGEEKPYTVHKIVGYCISIGDAKTGYYIPVGHKVEEGCPDLNVKPQSRVEAAITHLCREAQPIPKPGCQDPLSFNEIEVPPRVVIDFWHASFDQEFLYPITGIDWWHPESFEDGMLAAFVLYSDDFSYELKEKAETLLRDPEGHPYQMIKLKELFVKGRKIDFSTLSPDEPGVIKYACSDGICTRLLCEDLATKARAPKFRFTYRLEKQVSQVKRVMERPRVKINREKIQVAQAETEKKREEYRQKIIALALSKGFKDFEPGSPKQLAEFLFSDQGLNITLSDKSKSFPDGKPQKTKNGQFKTDTDTFEELIELMGVAAPPVLEWVIAYRKEDKVLGTYLHNMNQNLDENDELRFSFKQHGAATGRFSAPAGDPEHGYSGIPIHGIPATSVMRTCFESRDGYIMVKCDYAGQELRIVTNLCHEPVWVKEFLEGDGDLHTITARAFFNKQEVTKEERKGGKCVHPDTLVWVNGQLVPVGEAVAYSSEPDSFLEVSGQVYDGTHYVPLEASYKGGRKSLVHVVVSGGLETCTPEHRFLLRDGTFRRAGDLKKGDLLVETTCPPLPSLPFPNLSVQLWEGVPAASYQMTADLAYFCGLFAGDGTGSASSLGLTHGESDKIDAYGNPYEEWVAELTRTCHRCGFDPSRKDPRTLYLGSRVLVRLFRALGVQGGRHKRLRVPSWVMATGQEAVLQYLGGLFDTDGTVGGDTPNLDVTTKDFVFAGQVSTLLRSCDLDHTLELTFNKTYQRHYVRLRLSVGASWKMHSYLRHSGKRDRLRPPVYNGRIQDRFTVRGVLDAGIGDCVDLSVSASDHVYWTNGFTTHNTANFALIYGGGPASIMRATGCNRPEAQRRKQAFDKSVPVFATWLKNQHARVKKELGVYNAFHRWIAIPDANIKPGDIVNKDTSKERVVEAEEANARKAACERKSVNYPVQSSGADIMKICMVFVHKQLYKRGWLKNGGDDSVRMLLSVHDELVFEIKPERLLEALDVIVTEMERPDTLPVPKWQVPLVVDPVVGKSWGAEVKCYRYAGKPIKQGEHKLGKFVFNQLPDWLAGIQDTVVETPEEPVEAALEVKVPSPEVKVESPSTGQVEALVEKPEGVPEEPRPQKVKPKVAVIRLKQTTAISVRQVQGVIGRWLDPDGVLIHLICGMGGETLVDPRLGIKVELDPFMAALLELNLSDGRYSE